MLVGESKVFSEWVIFNFLYFPFKPSHLFCSCRTSQFLNDLLHPDSPAGPFKIVIHQLKSKFIGLVLMLFHRFYSLSGFDVLNHR